MFKYRIDVQINSEVFGTHEPCPIPVGLKGVGNNWVVTHYKQLPRITLGYSSCTIIDQ